MAIAFSYRHVDTSLSQAYYVDAGDDGLFCCVSLQNGFLPGWRAQPLDPHPWEPMVGETKEEAVRLCWNACYPDRRIDEVPDDSPHLPCFCFD